MTEQPTTEVQATECAPEVQPIVKDLTLMQRGAIDAWLAAETNSHNDSAICNRNRAHTEKVLDTWCTMFARTFNMEPDSARRAITTQGERYVELLANAGNMRNLLCESQGKSRLALDLMLKAIVKLGEFCATEMGMSGDETHVRVQQFHDGACQCETHYP